ncbi:MAG: HAMP domain-containing protein, partial [Armatimonadota bacterium]|nr:HAMP domain-containing protein [Armatimonadota bacterium]
MSQVRETRLAPLLRTTSPPHYLMRSLFLQIFLWFWLAMALLGLALYAVTVTTQLDPVVPPQRWAITDALNIHSQRAVALYERGGQRALVQYLRRMERKAHVRTFLFDVQGHEVSGRTAPPGARDLAVRVAQSGDAEFQITRTHVLGAQYARGPRGSRYVLLAAMPRNLLAAVYVRPKTRLLRILAVLLTGIFVCYGLARYLTAPVVKLRAATRQLAAGDLTARVGPAMGQRRDELADLGRDFDLMAERIESLMLSQRRLLGDISHELRSPLTRLNLALGIARRQA